jgi:hypothetical protein
VSIPQFRSTSSRADLAARVGFLKKNPLVAFRIVDDLQHWQKDPDLTVVRDDKERQSGFGQTNGGGRVSDNQQPGRRRTSGPRRQVVFSRCKYDVATRQA